ncbi:MAG: MazG family protein [Micrococcaceae bacterium]
MTQYQGLTGLIDLMHTLRNECDWDNAQTHDSLTKFLIEECFELVDAIEIGTDQDLKEELGDVLLQVVFHSEIAKEENHFNIDDVAQVVTDKMIARHPEIFAGTKKKYNTLEEREQQWQQDKRTEKAEREGPFDGIPNSAPALFQAKKMIDRAQKLEVKLPETPNTPGGQLFSLIQEFDSKGLDPEAELRSYLRTLRS